MQTFDFKRITLGHMGRGTHNSYKLHVGYDNNAKRPMWWWSKIVGGSGEEEIDEELEQEVEEGVENEVEGEQKEEVEKRQLIEPLGKMADEVNIAGVLKFLDWIKDNSSKGSEMTIEEVIQFLKNILHPTPP